MFKTRCYYKENEQKSVEDNMKRNILLNPGPATTTDTVKMAQVVPDICPREKEFASMMKSIREDLVRIVHGDLDKYTAVLFCGSGTLNIDVCINSLIPKDKQILIVNNGAYSQRAVEVCQYYGLDYVEAKFPIDELPDLDVIDKTLEENKNIAVVYTTHNETGTGILNPIREIGAIAHKHDCTFIVDTTSTYAMRPIDMDKDNVDFCMASAQKGLMAMTGLSFVIGNKSIIEKSKDYPKRSYYCNLYLQYAFFEKTGEMHFTPPVQTIYATKQALTEYFAEGEMNKWARHTRVFEAIHKGIEKLGLKDVIKREYQSGLVVSVKYPDDPNWSFEKVHDYCYDRGFTIYPGKISTTNTFRLCALGAIDEKDIEDFFVVLEESFKEFNIAIPAIYK
jgi:2-aminoethylphosphonate-pyruvate transaminase